MEEWKTYKIIKHSNAQVKKGDIVEVSNLGRIKINGKIIQPRLNGKYYKFGVEYVHRIVAQLFIPNPDNKTEVDHIKCNRFDNSVNNLKWVTHTENMNNPLTLDNHNINRNERNKKISNAITGKHWKVVDGKRVWY